MGTIIGTTTVKKHSVLAFACGLLLCGLLSPVQGVYYIDRNATGTPEDGSSWSQAFRTIPTAVTKATGEFWVAQGVYTHTTSMDIKTNNIFYGGFTSGMTDLSQRDWVNNRTIFDGQATKLILAKAANGPVTVDGFILQNGTNSSGGGAMYIGTSGTVTLNNCTFSNNIVGTRGGAVYFRGDSVAIVSNCTFFANKQVGTGNTDGGGAFRFGDTASGVFSDCRFLSNRTVAALNAGSGGAISAANNVLAFERCLFSNNVGIVSGGAIVTTGLLILNDCDFVNNSCSNMGGAVYSTVQVAATNCDFVDNMTTNGSGGAIAAGPIEFRGCNFVRNISGNNSGGAINCGATTIVGCNFLTNSCLASGSGGAIALTTSLVASNCYFANNTASNFAGAIASASANYSVFNSDFVLNTSMYGGGGALYHSLSSGSTTNVFKNCAFVANASTNGANGGGGAVLELGKVNDTFVNCTFLSNSTTHATTGNAPGGAIRANVASSILTITNCIFWGNSASGAGQTLSQSATTETLNLSYSDINTNAANFNLNANCVKNYGAGIINLDPQFASAVAPYDVHLMSKGGRYNPATSTWVKDAVNSPCIDKGSPASDCSLEPLPNGGLINLGRYGGTLYASKTEAAGTPKGALILVR